MATYQITFHAEGDGKTKKTPFNIRGGDPLLLYGVLAAYHRLDDIVYIKLSSSVVRLKFDRNQAISVWVFDGVVDGQKEPSYKIKDVMARINEGYRLGINISFVKPRYPWWQFWR